MLAKQPKNAVRCLRNRHAFGERIAETRKKQRTAIFRCPTREQTSCCSGASIMKLPAEHGRQIVQCDGQQFAIQAAQKHSEVFVGQITKGGDRKFLRRGLGLKQVRKERAAFCQNGTMGVDPLVPIPTLNNDQDTTGTKQKDYVPTHKRGSRQQKNPKRDIRPGAVEQRRIFFVESFLLLLFCLGHWSDHEPKSTLVQIVPRFPENTREKRQKPSLENQRMSPSSYWIRYRTLRFDSSLLSSNAVMIPSYHRSAH